MDREAALKRYFDIEAELDTTFVKLVELRNDIEQLKGINKDTSSDEVDWDLRYLQYKWGRDSLFEMGKNLGLHS